MKRHALVVGINEWRDKRIGKLKCAVRDAAEVAIFLGRLNFQPVVHLQPDEADLHTVTAQLNSLGEGLSADDLLLVFFAGHGITHDDYTWLMCADALRDTLDSPDRVGFLGVHTLVKQMRAQGAFNRLIITDACRDDSRAGRTGGDWRFRGASGYRTLGHCDSGEKVGHVLLNSCEDEKRALELDRHGLFTQALLQLWEEKRAQGAPIRMSADFRDELGQRMQNLARAHGLPADEQWPLLVEGRPIPFALDGNAAPASSDRPPGEPAALPPKTQPSVEPPHPSRYAEERERLLNPNRFCSVCGRSILTTLDHAGHCQYAGCAEPICSRCWRQGEHFCTAHRVNQH